MSTLTRDQADLLAAYGWQTSQILINPNQGIADAKASMSGAVTSVWWWNTDGQAIHATRWTPDRWDPERVGRTVEVPWSLLRAAAKAAPDRLLADLGKARRCTQREWCRKFSEFVPWAPGGRAPHVEPPPDWHREAEGAERRAVAAVLDALTLDSPAAVVGQLDLFAVAS